MRRRVGTPVLLLGLVLACHLCACSDAQRAELVVSIDSDLTPGSELSAVLVELWNGQDGSVAQAQWLTVGSGCQAGADGRSQLGSLLVEWGAAKVAQLNVRGFTSLQGQAVQIVARRVDVSFQSGARELAVSLSRACRGAGPCAADSTCNPASGACEPVPHVEDPPRPSSAGSGPHCLVRADMPPPVWSPSSDASAALPLLPDGGLATARCVAGDGQCPAGCYSDRDFDCFVLLHRPCGPTTDACVPGAFCIDGFCCDQTCTGECERCDLRGSEGRCSHVAYSAVDAPWSDPAFSIACAKDHITVSCTAGKCGYACAQGYDSCDLDLQSNGCETPLDTAANCARCGDACVYAYCKDRACQSHHTTDLSMTDSTALTAGSLYATRLIRTSLDTKVRALGALVDRSFAGKRLRLALYKVDQALLPHEMLVQTDDLMVEDNSRSAVPARSDLIRVEQTLSADLAEGAAYFIAVQASERTQLFGANGQLAEWNVAAFEYGEFPKFYPFPANGVSGLAWSIYAITTEK